MAVTLTAAITDKNGLTVFSRASLAENTTTTIWADKYNELGTTIVEGKLLRTPMLGPVTFTLTPSAATHGTFNIYVYYENYGRVLTYPFNLVVVDSDTTKTAVLPIDGYLVGLAVTAPALASPSASPSSSESPSASASVSPSSSNSPSQSPSTSASASASPSASPSPSASQSVSSSPSASTSISQSSSVSASRSPSPSPSASVSQSYSSSASPSPSASGSASQSPSASTSPSV